MLSDRIFTGSILVLAGLAITSLAMTNAATPPNGKAVFDENCAKCHAAGGNIITPSKPIIGSQKLESFPTFKAYLENPLGHMPYYSHIVKDQAALRALYDYCKTLKPAEQS